MTTLRKSWWALALSVPFAMAAAGCSNEPTIEVTPGESKSAPPAPVTPLDKEGAAPKAAPPATVAEPEKAEAPKVEAPKADAPKVEAPQAEPPKAEAPKVEAPKGASTVKLSDEQVAELKKLPAEEQTLALKQVVCPISDEPLGSMGVPVKVLAEGKAVFVCCTGCSKGVEADPKATLAKLNLK